MLCTDLADRKESLCVLFHRGPPEALFHECQGASYPRVTGQVGDVSPLENLRAETGRDKQTIIGTITGGITWRYLVFYPPGYHTDDARRRKDTFQVVVELSLAGTDRTVRRRSLSLVGTRVKNHSG